MIDANTPCGNCDMGTYCEDAALNRKAREFSVLTYEQRQANLPRCKSLNRACVGARHYSEMIRQIDERLEK